MLLGVVRKLLVTLSTVVGESCTAYNAFTRALLLNEKS